MKKRFKRKLRPRRNSVRVPRTVQELSLKSGRFQDIYSRALNVISQMRSGHISLAKASKEFQIDPRTVARLMPSALRKNGHNRYSVKENEKLLRVLVIPTPQGLKEIGVRGPKSATLIAQHANAVRQYIQTGDARALKRFRNKSVKDANGNKLVLLTELVLLDELANAGVLSFESLYARSA